MGGRSRTSATPIMHRHVVRPVTSPWSLELFAAGGSAPGTLVPGESAQEASMPQVWEVLARPTQDGSDTTLL
jgi:hypothetical protein